MDDLVRRTRTILPMRRWAWLLIAASGCTTAAETVDYSQPRRLRATKIARAASSPPGVAELARTKKKQDRPAIDQRAFANDEQLKPAGKIKLAQHDVGEKNRLLTVFPETKLFSIDDEALPLPEPAALQSEPLALEPIAVMVESDTTSESEFPVNLAAVLQLAGANNLQLAMAAEQVREAHARLEGAEVLWIPTIRGGVGYNKHDGRIQATEGQVLEVSRNSIFVGGGAGISGAPLTGASGGPARMFVDLSPADIYFAPLAARQSKNAAHANESATYNDTLLEVTLGYLELLRAQSQVGIADEAIKNAEKLAKLTADFERVGAGLEADAARARAELAERRRERLAAEERLHVVSAELSRMLRLDQSTELVPVDDQPVPLTLIALELPLQELIAQGLTSRPELARHQALLGETLQRLRQEKWRPWLPNLHVGMSAGGFGGGPGSFSGRFADRSDFDALAVWELRNFGLGNRAIQRERSSQHRQACIDFQLIRDRVAAEVAQAHHQVRFRDKQIDQAREQVKQAKAALPLNFIGIEGGVLEPIEVQQAIVALRNARIRHLDAIVDYNRAQFKLLRAMGEPPEAPVTVEQMPEAVAPAPPE